MKGGVRGTRVWRILQQVMQNAPCSRARFDPQIDGAMVTCQLERWDPGKTLLVSRGFHWISENSFNR